MTALAPTPTDTDNPELISEPVASPAGRVDVDPARLLRAKTAYTTRFLAQRLADDATGYSLERGPYITPRAGDVVLARVVEFGKHKRIESEVSRRRHLFVGDEILVAYGHRYAPDQFEAEVPPGLGFTNLAAAGGLAGDVTAVHGAIEGPTVIEPLGLLATDAGVVTLADLAPYRPTPGASRATPWSGVPVIAVFGTSMNSGKSTTLACLTRGLALSGMYVAAGKATGTGAGNDRHMFDDAGAARVLDFTDFGYGSTFRLETSEMLDLVASVIGELSADPRSEAVVVEIADGIFQDETRAILEHPVFREAVDAVVFTAGDAAGALAGSSVIAEAGLPLVAVSGLVAASPLATREADDIIGVPVVPTYDLADPQTVRSLIDGVVTH